MDPNTPTNEDVTNLVTENGAEGESPEALEGEDAGLFAALAEHDDYAPTVMEEEALATESATAPVSGATDAEQTPAAVPATPAPSPAAVAAPPPEPAPPTVNTEPGAAATEQPSPASAAAPETPPATAPAEPVDFAKHREEYLPKLADVYKLSDDEAEALRLEPEKVLPKLAAKVHYDVITAVFNSVVSEIPQLVKQTLETAKRETELEESFYGKWPKLRGQQALPTVMNSIRAYRTANPTAPVQDVIEKAGLMAMLSLGINPMEAPAPVPASAPAVVPQVPERPVAPAGVGAGSAPFQASRQPGSEDDISALVSAELRGELY